MKGRLYKSIKSKEEIESSQLFNTMIQRIEGTDSVLIDGRNLMADSIYAKHIKAGEITADHLKAGAITADAITTGDLDLKNIKLKRGNETILSATQDGVIQLNVTSLNIGSLDVLDELENKETENLILDSGKDILVSEGQYTWEDIMDETWEELISYG